MTGSILVIDDDADLRDLIALALTLEGYVVYTAQNGRVGLAVFDAAQPDLVITDILMPEVEGMATILGLRGKTARPKILAISGGGRLVKRDVLKWAMHLGADEVLAKPFRMSTLTQMVRDLLAVDVLMAPTALPLWLDPAPEASAA